MSAPTERTIIDGLEFARAERELRGHLSTGDFARLQDCLHGDESSIDFLLKGGRDRQRRLVLRVEICGLLELQCQRCLGRLDYPLQILNTLLLVRQNVALPTDADEPHAPDCLVTDAAIDVAALIEDEILLGLPLAPRHADGTCSSATGNAGRDSKVLPFARLAALKK
jgi:uncharacterized protein